jgi:hypothetical protein
MKNLPAREKLDLAEKVATYLVTAGALDKNAPLEDHERATELSLELAMLLPATLYRAMVEATAHPSAKVNPSTVAILVRQELLGIEAGDLEPGQIAVHVPGAAPKAKPRTH